MLAMYWPLAGMGCQNAQKSVGEWDGAKMSVIDLIDRIVLTDENIISECETAFRKLRFLSFDKRVELINGIRKRLSIYSPFNEEPVDCVQWVKNECVVANDYNPNSVAPPEMELLRLSIAADGYTQPIVTNKENKDYEVVDGFHRCRVGKECDDIFNRVSGYLPIVQIKQGQSDRSDRIAATIRHNRARGKHQVEKMSDIVIELKKRNWTEEKIAKNLGMDKDEILRLCQISGLAEVFSDQEFSRAWDIEGEITEADFRELNDDISQYENELKEETRTTNTSDGNRIFHTWDKWECYKAGLYATTHPKLTKGQCEEAYRAFLSNLPQFETALNVVINEWKHSCEHYLTNSAMNRIAWLGQAAACQALGIPAMFRGGFYELTDNEQTAANELALVYLNKWLVANKLEAVTLEEAYSYERQSDIY